MKIIDISAFISSTMGVWPGAPKTEFSWRRSMPKGDRSNNSNFFMNSHSGTHVDAPLHFVKDGKSVDSMSLEAMIGEAFVFDLSKRNEITVEDLEKGWPKKGTKRVLIKTSNSKLWKDQPNEFVKDYIALTKAPTHWLLDKRVALIGIDYLSIQRFGDPPIVHQILLEAGVVIVEGLDLSNVDEGMYQLICLPIKLAGLEAAPARVILSSLQS